MKKIGLTGIMGSGKTYVADVFHTLGVPIFNADLQSKKILDSSLKIQKLIKKEFGADVFVNNILDKKRLADVVFTDNDKLDFLNKILHPLVKKSFEDWVLEQDSEYVIKESAILFESNSHKDLHKIICVTASLEICFQRIFKRDNVTRKDIQNRLAHQMSSIEKEKRSDYVIFNNENNMILEQVLKIHKSLMI